MDQSFIAYISAGIVIAFFILVGVFASRYRKVGPNEALIIFGRGQTHVEQDGRLTRRAFRIVRGGGSIVWPVVEQAELLSLELMTIDVTTPEVYTLQGVPVMVDGVAQVKVKSDDVSIATSAEQFLGKNVNDVRNIALQTLEGHLRAILGMMTIEEIYKERDKFAKNVTEVAEIDLANMGLTIVSFTIKDIRDKQGYLDALGKPQIAVVKRNAVIAEAEAQRDATIKSAQANQLGQTAKLEADTKVAASKRDYEMQVADYAAATNQRKAEADLAYDLQKFKTQQLVAKEQIQVQTVEKESMIAVQEKEIVRKERELDATIRKPAEAEKHRIETLADAEKYKLQATAEGQAEATRATGIAQADAEKAKGLAQAEVIKAQGSSEAEAMSKKAEAWRAYNEAAITQVFIEKLPEIARAISEPLSRIDRMVVISGSDGGGGASRITQDVTNILAQLPPVIEAISGIDLKDLVGKLPQMGKATGETPPAETTG